MRIASTSSLLEALLLDCWQACIVKRKPFFRTGAADVEARAGLVWREDSEATFVRGEAQKKLDTDTAPP